MLRKSFAFILISFLTCAIAVAQNIPVPMEVIPADLVFSGRLRSYLGVHLREISKENFSKYSLSNVRGVAVEKVTKDSPAAKAGLRDGDVIVRFNGESVTSVRKLRRLISEVAPDHKMDIAVIRSGIEKNLRATIGKLPGAVLLGTAFSSSPILEGIIGGSGKSNDVVFFDGLVPDDSGVTVVSGRSNHFIGFGSSPLTKQLGKHFGVSDGNGMLVDSVRKDSPAEKAGLRAGDVIVEVDGKKIKNGFDLIRGMYKKNKGSVDLTIVRNKSRKNINVTPEKR